MAKRKPGWLLMEFGLFGLKWEVRTVKAGHKALIGDGGPAGMGICYMDKRLIYLSCGNSDEQARTTLAHEIQHVIEDHADVDYTNATDEATADRMTDQVARGWLLLLRENPHLVDYLRAVA